MSSPVLATFRPSAEAETLFSEISEAFPSDLHLGREAEAISWVEDQMRVAGEPAGISQLPDLFSQGAEVVRIVGGTVDSVSLPPTPEAYLPPADADVWPFDIRHLALTSLIGFSYGSGHLRGGRIIADIFPKAQDADRQDTAFGSSKNFDFHADGVVHPDTMPECFSIHCLKNPTAVPTIVSTVREDDFEPATYQALRRPEFTIYYEGWRAGAHHLDDISLLEDNPDGTLRLNYYGGDKVVSRVDDADHRSALLEFAEALDKNAVPLSLRPGEIVLIKNKQIVHSRPPFSTESMDDSNRRWLRRVFATTNPTMIERITELGPHRVVHSVHVKTIRD
jgi:hypothetical protein